MRWLPISTTTANLPPASTAPPAPKLQWGIRDTGATGAATAPRSWTTATPQLVRLCGPSRIPSSRDLRLPALRPVFHRRLAILVSRFRALASRPPRYSRAVVVAGPDVRRCPARDAAWCRPTRRTAVRWMRWCVAASEARPVLSIGFTAAAALPAIIIGQRYFWNVEPHRAPDVAAEAVALVSVAHRPFLEGTLWASCTPSTPSRTSSLAAAGFPSIRPPTSRPAQISASDAFPCAPPWRVVTVCSIRASRRLFDPLKAPVPLRRSERVLCAFFFYIAVLCAWRIVGFRSRAPLPQPSSRSPLFVGACRFQSTRRGWSIARDWIAAARARRLLEHRSGPTPHGSRAVEDVLIVWDHAAGWLEAARGDGATRRADTRLLELAYSILYVVLPVSIASFYVRHERDRLSMYSLPIPGRHPDGVCAPAPLSCGRAPSRLRRPGPPQRGDVFRQINVWILDHWDIQSSVFPSGHVAAAFSAALAVRLAAPDRRRLSGALLALALLVWVNTVYSRYHYAADGLAGLALSASVIGLLFTYGAHRSGGKRGARISSDQVLRTPHPAGVSAALQTRSSSASTAAAGPT